MKAIKKYKPRRAISKKQFSPKKESARSKGYDKDWDKYRWRFLHYNKVCYACGDKSKVVDHIIPAKGDKDIFEATNNHMPLCTSCHNTITGKFDRYKEPKTIEKMRWIAQKRKEFGVVSKVKPIQYRK